MKLHEFLSEDKLETRTAEDLWLENEADAKAYVSKTIYLVKAIKKHGKTQYDVYQEVGDDREHFGTMDHAALNDSFQPLRPDQTEDAEGFTKYIEVGDVEAIRYTGPKIKVDLGGPTEKLSKGDYLIRTEDIDDEITYHVEKARYFEDEYTEKK
jgi:hypothetical protein